MHNVLNTLRNAYCCSTTYMYNVNIRYLLCSIILIGIVFCCATICVNFHRQCIVLCIFKYNFGYRVPMVVVDCAPQIYVDCRKIVDFILIHSNDCEVFIYIWNVQRKKSLDFFTPKLLWLLIWTTSWKILEEIIPFSQFDS